MTRSFVVRVVMVLGVGLSVACMESPATAPEGPNQSGLLTGSNRIGEDSTVTTQSGILIPSGYKEPEDSTGG